MLKKRIEPLALIDDPLCISGLDRSDSDDNPFGSCPIGTERVFLGISLNSTGNAVLESDALPMRYRVALIVRPYRSLSSGAEFQQSTRSDAVTSFNYILSNEMNVARTISRNRQGWAAIRTCLVGLAILCACSCSSIAAELACPKNFKELVTASDRAFDNLESVIKAGDKTLRCRTAKNFVIAEQKLLNFLEGHQVGCEIDISQIERQQRRLKRAESWQSHDLVGCGKQ